VILPQKKENEILGEKLAAEKKQVMNIIRELEVDDLKIFLRMDIASFEKLLAIVTPYKDALMRNAISV
jgi:hypothetical protein